jgi:hypothetical protein
MFEEKGSFTPFEARWLPEGRIQLRPADERSSDFVSVFFRLEYQEAGIPTNMVVETIKGTETFPLSTTTKPGPAPVPIGRASFSGA